MKNQFVLAGIVLLALTGLSAGQSNDSSWCGTNEAIAAMRSNLRSSAFVSATTIQAGELLLYLNFDGGIYFSGSGNADTHRSSIISGTRFCPPPALDEEQKAEIVRLVQDDFSPFNITVTTDAALFAAAPGFTKEMCVITTLPAVIGHPSDRSGVSPFGGLGIRLPRDLAFVFSEKVADDPAAVAALVSHESAHLLGLTHQSLFDGSCGFVTEYHPGFGSGLLAFGPLMGYGLDSGIDNWFAQSCANPLVGLPQDDYELINSQVAVRADDFPDSPSGDTVTVNEINGVLERAGDADLIKINFKNPGPVMVTSDNIDLKVSVLNNGGKIMEQYNDPNDINVTIPRANGMRFLKVEAAGNANMSAEFMTGQYKITY